MAKRILLAGVLGGIAMFVWSSLAHDVLPLGQVGISEIPAEPAVLSSMQTAMGQKSGLYLFPGWGLDANASRDQKKAAMEQYSQKLATSPSGMLIYHPPGAKGFSAGLLGFEFFTEVLEALLVVFLLAQTGLQSFAARVGFVTVAGVMAAITTNLPYWNWYGFPTNYTATYMMIEIIGYIVVGFVAAAIIKNEKQVPRAIGRAA